MTDLKELKEIEKRVPHKVLGANTFLTGAVRCSFPEVFEMAHSKKYPDRKPQVSITLLMRYDDPQVPELIKMIIRKNKEVLGSAGHAWS